MNNDEFPVVEREMAPKLAEFSDKITQNIKLFKRIEAVYNSPEKQKLTPGTTASDMDVLYQFRPRRCQPR